MIGQIVVQPTFGLLEFKDKPDTPILLENLVIAVFLCFLPGIAFQFSGVTYIFEQLEHSFLDVEFVDLEYQQVLLLLVFVNFYVFS